MTEMKLSKSEYFDGIECDFYSDGKDAFMTREQIGAALGYADPIRAISKLHARKKDRLDKYSVVVKLTTTDGKAYDTRVYNRKGVMEICRHSDQPRADDFIDFAWEIMDSIARGDAALMVVPKDFPAALRALADSEERRMALEVENAQQRQMLAEYNPKVSYYDIVLQTPDVLPITTIAKDYGKSGRWMNQRLHELGVQYKQGKVWLLYQKYAEQGYTKTKTETYLDRDGAEHSTVHTYWTQKGRLFLYDLLKEHGIVPLIEQEAA